VGFDVTDQLLIRSFAFVRYRRRMGGNLLNRRVREVAARPRRRMLCLLVSVDSRRQTIVSDGEDRVNFVMDA
jgi:hypothetical protein